MSFDLFFALGLGAAPGSGPDAEAPDAADVRSTDSVASAGSGAASGSSTSSAGANPARTSAASSAGSGTRSPTGKDAPVDDGELAACFAAPAAPFSGRGAMTFVLPASSPM